MAIKLTGPAENSVLIDANITEIIFEHIDNQEHYHYAQFYIDNILFDELVIPRISNSKMILQFSNLLLKSIEFPDVVDDETIQPYRLDRNLRIEVYKKKKDLITPTNTLNYILRYAIKPTIDRFDFNTWLDFIDVKPQIFVVNQKAKILLPFYTRNTENLSVNVIDNEGLILFSGEFSFTDFNTFLIHLNIDAPSSSVYYTLIIKSGTVKIERYFRILKYQLYDSKQIKLRNVYGFPMHVELFGKLSIKDDLSVTSYQNQLGEIKTAEIKEETTFTIDSGYLTEKERPIISQIINSQDIAINHGSNFINCVPTVKSITTYTDGEFVTQNQLSFKFNKNPKFKN